MIDYTTIRQIIEEYIDDNFTLCPVKYENVPLDTKGEDKWVAVFDEPTNSESLGMAEDAYLATGALIIQIFTPLGSGTAGAREIAYVLADLFNQENVEGINFEEPELHRVNPPADATWYQMNLVIHYKTIMGQEQTC